MLEPSYSADTQTISNCNISLKENFDLIMSSDAI